MKFAVTIPPGLVSDDTPFLAEGGAYDCSGARCWQDAWQQMGGYESITFILVPGVTRSVFQWSDNAGLTNIALGRHNGLSVWVGGMTYNITPAGFVAGSIDGSAGAGYGTGKYGEGPYGEPSTDPTFPMTWALSAYGENLIANARGQGIWQWLNNTAAVAVPVANAPAQNNYAIVVPQRQIVSFGCTPIGGGDLDPLLIRGSDIENITNWTPTTANASFDYVLDSGSYIVTARVVANYLFVWTDTAFYLGTFIGAPDETWRFERQGMHCGALGVGAPVVVGQSAVWPSADGQFWTASIGGPATRVPCTIQKAFAENLATGQNDKVVGTTISKFGELRWFYADSRDGFEVSRSVAVNDKGQWSRDASQPRTAFCDANPSSDPIGVTFGGNLYWQERGETADGGRLSGYLRTSDFYLGDGEDLVQVNGVWPDFLDQQGAMSLTATTRLYPQDANPRTRGPFNLSPNQRKRDFRATGRVLSLLYEWNASPASGRWGKQTFYLELAGQR